MPFSYYRKLSPLQKRVYDKSAGIGWLNLQDPHRFYPYTDYLKKMLMSESQPHTELAAQRLVSFLTSAFRVTPVRVRVLSKRPSRNWGELHGLYEQKRGEAPTITLWMRTAKLDKVVMFKTFLRTLVHEVVHHLDYALLKLPDSFHTEGFYRRESNLLNQLCSVSLPSKQPILPA